MKQLFFILLLALFISSCHSQENYDLNKIRNELNALEGKYIHDKDIFEIAEINNRLLKLLGNEIFDDVTECFMTVTPYKISDDIFYFSGFSKLSYNSCNIAFDMKNNAFHVKIAYDESGEEKVFSDDMKLYNKLPEEIIN
jgi:hypothetical protein